MHTQRGLETREAAHASIIPTKRSTCAEILAFGRELKCFGFIVDEVVAAWGCTHNHIAPRVAELVQSGELVDSGTVRKTRTGRSARVFVLPEFAGKWSISAAPTNQVALSPSPDGMLGLPSNTSQSSIANAQAASLFGDMTRYPD